MSPARVTTKVRAARTSVPTKMMALHNRAAARVHPRASTPPRDRGVILGHWTSTTPDVIAVPKSTVMLLNVAKLSHHHFTTPQRYADTPNDANKGPTTSRRSPSSSSSSSQDGSRSQSSSSTTGSSTPTSPSPIHRHHTHH